MDIFISRALSSFDNYQFLDVQRSLELIPGASFMTCDDNFVVDSAHYELALERANKHLIRFSTYFINHTTVENMTV